jgi:hypothetical protein
MSAKSSKQEASKKMETQNEANQTTPKRKKKIDHDDLIESINLQNEA